MKIYIFTAFKTLLSANISIEYDSKCFSKSGSENIFQVETNETVDNDSNDAISKLSSNSDINIIKPIMCNSVIKFQGNNKNSESNKIELLENENSDVYKKRSYKNILLISLQDFSSLNTSSSLIETFKSLDQIVSNKKSINSESFIDFIATLIISNNQNQIKFNDDFTKKIFDHLLILVVKVFENDLEYKDVVVNITDIIQNTTPNDSFNICLIENLSNLFYIIENLLFDKSLLYELFFTIIKIMIYSSELNLHLNLSISNISLNNFLRKTILSDEAISPVNLNESILTIPDQNNGVSSDSELSSSKDFDQVNTKSHLSTRLTPNPSDSNIITSSLISDLLTDYSKTSKQFFDTVTNKFNEAIVKLKISEIFKEESFLFFLDTVIPKFTSESIHISYEKISKSCIFQVIDKNIIDDDKDCEENEKFIIIFKRGSLIDDFDLAISSYE